MNSTKIVFILSLLFILAAKGQSQSTYKGCYGFDCKEKKWSVSLFGGLSILGPGQKISDQMIASGLGDVGEVFVPYEFETRDYPLRTIGTSWNISIGYSISKKSGLQLTTGNSYHASVAGYDNIGLGNNLRIESNVWTTCLNYVWKLRNGKDGFTIGPVIANYTANADNQQVFSMQVTSSSAMKAGFNGGYTFSLVQKKSWFLKGNVNYTWLPDAEIGPYKVEHELDAYSSEPEVYTSTFAKTKVPLSHINFGISTGFRF